MTLEKKVNKLLLSDKKECHNRVKVQGENYCGERNCDCAFYEKRTGINIKGHFFNGCFYWDNVISAIYELNMYTPHIKDEQN